MLSKDSANRKENKISLFIFYPEMQPILSKDSANRKENKISYLFFMLTFFLHQYLLMVNGHLAFS